MPSRSSLLDLFQPLLDVVHHAVHVVALLALLAHLAQALHQVLQAHAALAVAVGKALAHQAFERAAQVAVAHIVIRERVEDALGVQIVETLRAIPARVAEGLRERNRSNMGSLQDSLRASTHSD